MTRYMNGFTLVEVLVSLFVLSVGVMGAAAMQLTALRTAQQSAHQTTALHMAIEMADGIRASQHTRSWADRDNPYMQIDFRSQHETRPDIDAMPALTCYATPCAASEMVEAEISNWISRLDKALPGARAKICRDIAPWDNASSSYTWDCVVGAIKTNAAIVIKIGWRRRDKGTDNSHVTDFPPSVAVAVVPAHK